MSNLVVRIKTKLCLSSMSSEFVGHQIYTSSWGHSMKHFVVAKESEYKNIETHI